MPLYEYQCTRCHKRVEKIQTFSAAPLTECEFCGGPLEKLLSAPAIQFKGSGWYVTDYAKKSGAAPAAKSESKPEGGSSASNGDGKKSESSSSGESSAPASPAPAPAPAKASEK